MWTQDLPLTIQELPRQLWPSLPPTLDPPLRSLFALGNLSLLGRPALAIVGARKASPAGLWLAEDFATAARESGLVVVSGLAHGIDAAAHRGARDATGPVATWPTIAVLGHGLDQVYPRAHESMARSILAEGGLLLSEYPPGLPPRAHHFPLRNRLIAALAGRCLVIEAAARSGSLSTARAVLQQGGLVMVVPGCPLDPRSQGGNELLQQGAALVARRRDLLQELGLAEAHPLAEGSSTGQAPTAPARLEDWAAGSGLPSGEQMGLLLEWEAVGMAQRTLDGQWWVHPQAQPPLSLL